MYPHRMAIYYHVIVCRMLQSCLKNINSKRPHRKRRDTRYTVFSSCILLHFLYAMQSRFPIRSRSAFVFSEGISGCCGFGESAIVPLHRVSVR